MSAQGQKILKSWGFLPKPVTTVSRTAPAPQAGGNGRVAR